MQSRQMGHMRTQPKPAYNLANQPVYPAAPQGRPKGYPPAPTAKGLYLMGASDSGTADDSLGSVRSLKEEFHLGE